MNVQIKLKFGYVICEEICHHNRFWSFIIAKCVLMSMICPFGLNSIDALRHIQLTAGLTFHCSTFAVYLWKCPKVYQNWPHIKNHIEWGFSDNLIILHRNPYFDIKISFIFPHHLEHLHLLCNCIFLHQIKLNDRLINSMQKCWKWVEMTLRLVAQ